MLTAILSVGVIAVVLGLIIIYMIANIKD